MQPVIAQYNNFKKSIFEEPEPSELEKKIGKDFEALSLYSKKKYFLIGLAIFFSGFVSLAVVLAKEIVKMSISIFRNPPIIPYRLEGLLVICMIFVFAACAEAIYKITKISINIMKRPNI